MGTNNYNLPLIDGTKSAKVPRDFNMLSNSIDTTLKTELGNIVNLANSVASGAPKGVFSTVADLQTAFPTGNGNIYIVQADGKWYFWSNTSWVAGNVYQATGIPDGSIDTLKLSTGVMKFSEKYFSTRPSSVGYFSNKVSSSGWFSDNNSSVITLYDFTDYTSPLNFNGSIKNYGTINPNFGESFTAIMRIKPTAFSTTRRLLSFQVASVSFELALSGSGGLILSPGGIQTTANLILGKDVTIGIVVDNVAKTLRLFIDGVLNGQYTLGATTTFAGKTLFIGKNAQSDGSYFNGVIYKLALFKAALSDNEVISESTAMQISNNDALMYSLDNVTKILNTAVIQHKGEVLERYLDNLPRLDALLPKKKFMHISADDVIETFKNITANNYASIFDDPVMSFLKRMHEQYGMVFSGYCFYETADLTFNLSMVPNKWASEFKANASWLKFGYHYLNKNGGNFTTVDAATGLQYYNTGIAELFRICGGFESIDTVPRFHNYAAPLATVQAIAKLNLGVQGFLTSEDSRANYHLNTDQNVYMKTHDRLYDAGNGLKLFSTDLRLENVTDVSETLQSRLTDIAYGGRMHDLVIFTHEQYLTDVTMQQKVEACCQFANAQGYRFDFPMYNI